MLSSKNRYSLIIPAYNEFQSLSKLIDDVESLISKHDNLEVLIIDNGSNDNSFSFLKQELESRMIENLILLHKTVNTGYGAGICFALQSASGDVAIWTHSDLQCDILDVSRAINLYESLGDQTFFCVKGRRGSRRFVDAVFSLGLSAINLLANRVWVNDIHAQPNLVPMQLLQQFQPLPNNSTLELYFFTRARKAGIGIHRFPVQFKDRTFGKGANQGLRKKIRYSFTCIETLNQIRHADARH